MRQWIIATSVVLLGSLPAFGQFIIQNGGGAGSNNQMPNIYNTQNQPLSPWLNMQRNNPAVNYFFGARPGTAAGGYIGTNGNLMGMSNNSFMQQSFFPYVDTLASVEPGINAPGMMPSGHPVAFNNAMWYYHANSLDSDRCKTACARGRGISALQGRADPKAGLQEYPDKNRIGSAMPII